MANAVLEFLEFDNGEQARGMNNANNYNFILAPVWLNLILTSWNTGPSVTLDDSGQ